MFGFSSLTYFTQKSACLSRIGIDVENSKISILHIMRRENIEKGEAKRSARGIRDDKMDKKGT